jgi:hypothetical protein
MKPTDIQDQLNKGPFPMRLCFSDGSAFEIRHPELLMVSRSTLALTIMGARGAKLAERIILLDPVHLVRMEPINGNGSQRKRKTRSS